jgi:hypothetical protein
MQPKQRGGRRPGAGAPKGNLNGMRTGNHSDRMLMVYLAVRAHPDPKELAHELYHAGFIRQRTRRFNGDLRGLVAYLYNRWFEHPAEEPISARCNQTHHRHKRPPVDTK